MHNRKPLRREGDVLDCQISSLKIEIKKIFTISNNVGEIWHRKFSLYGGSFIGRHTYLTLWQMTKSDFYMWSNILRLLLYGIVYKGRFAKYYSYNKQHSH